MVKVVPKFTTLPPPPLTHHLQWTHIRLLIYILMATMQLPVWSRSSRENEISPYLTGQVMSHPCHQVNSALDESAPKDIIITSHSIYTTIQEVHARHGAENMDAAFLRAERKTAHGKHQYINFTVFKTASDLVLRTMLTFLTISRHLLLHIVLLILIFESVNENRFFNCAIVLITDTEKHKVR